MIPETKAFCPLGLGIVPYTLPGSNELADATLRELEDRMAEFINGEIDVLLAHPASCGYGLNLQLGGHHAIWFGLTWSLEQYEQANKRLHRQGQNEPVIIHHLITQGGMDETVIETLHSKGNMQDALMTALKARISRLYRKCR